MSLKVQDRDYYIYPEDDMPESQSQIDLYKYLIEILEFMYQVQQWFLTGNLAISVPPHIYPFLSIVPDISLFQGVVLSEAERGRLSSWKLGGTHRPPPTVVFEISSESTWKHDLDPKPEHYRLLGVKEYIAYDPLGIWPGQLRLRVWRYTEFGKEELVPDGRGWIWSEALESWLVPDNMYLRLYDRNGQIRLTKSQADTQGRKAAEVAQEKAEVVAQVERAIREKAEVAQEKAEALAQAEQIAREKAEAAQREAESVAQAEQAAREKAEAVAQAEREAREKAEAALQELLRKLKPQDAQ